MKHSKLFLAILGLLVNVCISLTGTVYVLNYVEDMKFVVEANSNAEIGDLQPLYCSGKGSIEKVGFFKNKVGFVCDNRIGHQEKATEELNQLVDDIQNSGLDMNSLQITIVQRYLGEGEWEMVQVWLTNQNLLEQENCPFTEDTIMGMCKTHILFWNKKGFFPFPTFNASLVKHLF